MNPYCWHCNRYTQEEPGHFNKKGECEEQMRDHIEQRKDFWREALVVEDHNADAINKRMKENPTIKRTDPCTGRDRN